MEQATATKHGGEPDSLNRKGLCLLSLDGGGVRGLSTLHILKLIMDKLNHERQGKDLYPVKPYEVFDLIGGTSTGGLIAIMLGRLQMDVDECISAYSSLMKNVFGRRSTWFPMNWTGRITARFDSNRLKNAIEEVITRRGFSNSDLFNDGTPRSCRVFVCTTAITTKEITRLRSYDLPDAPNISATICEAALATSAATGFFDPVSIGGRGFVDGALGANNPVDEVELEAMDIWCQDTGDLKPLVKCFISVGTGIPGLKAMRYSILQFLSRTLVQIATETEYTASKFISRWRHHFDANRYFRFNVEQGLEDVGLAEYEQQGLIEAATYDYVQKIQQRSRIRNCIQNLVQKEPFIDWS